LYFHLPIQLLIITIKVVSSIHAHGKDLISLFSNSKCLSIYLFSDKLGFGALQSDWHSKIKNLSPILHSNHILSIIGKHGRITSVLSASPPVIGRCMKSEQCTGFISLLYDNYDSSSLLYLNDLLSFVLYLEDVSYNQNTHRFCYQVDIFI
jgi:hypothetical protein